MSEDGPSSPQPNGLTCRVAAARNFLTRRPHAAPAVIAAVMLLAALGRWPYGYYTLLRWVVCAAAVFVVVLAVQYKKQWIAWTFGVVAVAFNPLIPIHLTREIWAWIDVGVAVAFLASIRLVRMHANETKTHEDTPGEKPKKDSS